MDLKPDAHDLALQIASEPDLEKKALLLRSFFHTPFPGSAEELLEYYESDLPALKNAAETILADIQSETIYDHARIRFANGDHSSGIISMLLRNYHPSDKQPLLRALARIRVDHSEKSGWHDICRAILRV